MDPRISVVSKITSDVEMAKLQAVNLAIVLSQDNMCPYTWYYSRVARTYYVAPSMLSVCRELPPDTVVMCSIDGMLNGVEIG